jgi:hypothetical protein
MWPRTFEARLTSWNSLRQDCLGIPLGDALEKINQWWFKTPWTPYHLHWDDRSYWPDPWQLLEDNIYCNLARGLGIMYTITLIDRLDLQAAQLTEVAADNLVVIPGEKYILNWAHDQIVNINLPLKETKHSVRQQQLKQQIQ